MQSCNDDEHDDDDDDDIDDESQMFEHIIHDACHANAVLQSSPLSCFDSLLMNHLQPHFVQNNSLKNLHSASL